MDDLLLEDLFMACFMCFEYVLELNSALLLDVYYLACTYKHELWVA
jgi:hypothetical protein